MTALVAGRRGGKSESAEGALREHLTTYHWSPGVSVKDWHHVGRFTREQVALLYDQWVEVDKDLVVGVDWGHGDSRAITMQRLADGTWAPA
jgi:hypothetical protein